MSERRVSGKQGTAGGNERESLFSRGIHSNVVVNLKAREAVALEAILVDAWTTDEDAIAAITKLLAAAERARVPWNDRA